MKTFNNVLFSFVEVQQFTTPIQPTILSSWMMFFQTTKWQHGFSELMLSCWLCSRAVRRIVIRPNVNQPALSIPELRVHHRWRDTRRASWWIPSLTEADLKSLFQISKFQNRISYSGTFYKNKCSCWNNDLDFERMICAFHY